MRAAILLLVFALGADEATLPGGKRLTGSLQWEKPDRLRFREAGRDLVPLQPGLNVRVEARPLLPSLEHASCRIALADGQILTGRLVNLDDKKLTLRPEWTDERTIARSGIVAILPPPNGIVIWEENFETELKSWRLVGDPQRNDAHHTSGRHCLLFAQADQSAQHTLSKPLEAGRLTLNFREIGPGGFCIEAGFGEERTVELKARDLKPAEGWRRLDLEFGPTTLVLSVDGEPLRYSRREGPGGSLHEIRLVAERGSVAFDDVRLSQPLDDLRRPPGDPTQDEVWLRSGDQLFGQVVAADARGVKLKGRFGERTLPWSQLRGVYLKKNDTQKATLEGEKVRLRLRLGDTTEQDVLEGIVIGLDDKVLTLRHALLGELRIERRRLSQVSWPSP